MLLNILEDLEILETDAKDLADLAFAGLLDFHKAKLEGQEFLDVSQVLQNALANESRAKEARDSQKSNENLIVLFMCSGVIPIVRTMKVKMFIPLNLFGPLMINLAFAVLLS